MLNEKSNMERKQSLQPEKYMKRKEKKKKNGRKKRKKAINTLNN